MQFGALIALLRGVTLPFLASISAVFESQLARRLRAGVAIRAPICLTRTSKFLSLMNPLLTQMLGESASVEIQASLPGTRECLLRAVSRPLRQHRQHRLPSGLSRGTWPLVGPLLADAADVTDGADCFI